MTIARYAITSGLSGCYMPDNHSGAMTFERRKDLADAIRYELQFMDWPAYLIRQVPLRRLWSHIVRFGSSSAHFSITHNGMEIAFHGLTEAEAEEMEAQQDY